MANQKKGKFNIIDFLIIVLIVAAAVFAGSKLMSGRESNNNAQLVQVTYHYNDVPEFVCEKLKVGAPIIDFNHDNLLGKVTKVETSDAVIYGTNSDGEIVTSTKDGYKSVTVTSELEVPLAANGFKIKKITYTEGYSFSLLCGNTKLYAEIIDIAPAE